ncbi:hypothetical protein CJF32_00004832 [Rutstroemia sp. NJR-2017a WRK4]|nr:hypothetical protein CJF32_00004832 [Rutstroemia sp. NJR-2017a WRK4]
MARDPYRSSTGDLGGGGGGGRGGGTRWDSDRFVQEREERERVRFADREDRESRFLRATAPGGGGHVRERSFDDVYERRGPRRFEEERYEERDYYDGPRFLQKEREPERLKRTTITMERERDYDDSPPPRRTPNRPAFLRRQSSLDTFDRQPLVRYERERERDEYGPPARHVDLRPPPLTPVSLPRRGPPSRRHVERDYYEDIKVAEPDFYGDDDFRAYPERIREREIVRRRRRSRSRESRSTATRSVRSSSISSSDSGTTISVRSEFPKKGKTRMPTRLVSKKAIIDLGYPFEEEGDTIIIQRALGRENIDEVIKLSEEYKTVETKEVETTLTTYRVGAENEMSGGRSEGTIIEERHEVYNIQGGPPPPPPVQAMPPPPTPHFAPMPTPAPQYAMPTPAPQYAMPPPQQYAQVPPPQVYTPMPPPPPMAPPPPQNVEIVHDTTIVEHRAPSPAQSQYSHHSHHHSHHEHREHHEHRGPVILEGRPREESSFEYERREIIERSEPMHVGPLGLAAPQDRRRSKDERAIRAEIRALEAEKELLKAERRASRRHRHSARASDSQLVLYGEDDRDVTIVREKIVEPSGGVRIEKDKKGPPPKLVRAMLATLT